MISKQLLRFNFSKAPDSSTTVDVTVSVNGQTKDLPNSFAFDPAKTPKISGISPQMSHVVGKLYLRVIVLNGGM